MFIELQMDEPEIMTIDKEIRRKLMEFGHLGKIISHLLHMERMVDDTCQVLAGDTTIVIESRSAESLAKIPPHFGDPVYFRQFPEIQGEGRCWYREVEGIGIFLVLITKQEGE